MSNVPQAGSPVNAPASSQEETPTVYAWADGACVPNPGHGACAAVLRFPDGRWITARRYLGDVVTNNQAEVHAIGLAVSIARRALPGCVVEVVSDSQYAIKTLTGEWSARANPDLIGKVRALLSRVSLRWEPRRTSKGAQTADDLAGLSVDDRQSEERAGRWEQSNVEGVRA